MTVKLEIDTKELVQSLDALDLGIKELTKPKVLDQISRAIFSITGERFMIDVDNYSRINPKKMHHVYEWGKIGNKSARLFVLERKSIIDGSLLISANFLPSKMPPTRPKFICKMAAAPDRNSRPNSILVVKRSPAATGIDVARATLAISSGASGGTGSSNHSGS